MLITVRALCRSLWVAGFLALAASTSARADLGVGDVLPTLSGADLNGHVLTLPAAVQGRVTLLALGFGDPSRLAVQAWAHRFLSDFGGDSAVACYEVSMVGGMGAWLRPWIEASLRRSTPLEDRARLLMRYGGTGDWKRRVGFDRDSDAYLLLLDREGRVALLHHGPFIDANYQNLAALVERLRH
jgi:hypothetical protein